MKDKSFQVIRADLSVFKRGGLNAEMDQGNVTEVRGRRCHEGKGEGGIRTRDA
jgi:hypothetical protein